LILVGPPLDAASARLADTLDLRTHLEVRSDAKDDELAQLYQTAALLLMPSLYEGFGWPALEAMALGCPVVCSTAGSLPEVVADAALTASVVQESRLADHALALLQDDALRQRMSAGGLARASVFRLEDVGRGLLSAYRAAAGG
jgi:glycosyltransferase involved in cell wall biosynthesis